MDNKLIQALGLDGLGRKVRVMVVAPHPDDEVIGCGGTLYDLAQENVEFRIVYVTDGCFTSNRNAGDRRMRATDATRVLGCHDEQSYLIPPFTEATPIRFLGWTDQSLSIAKIAGIAAQLEANIKEFRPDVVLTSSATDLNADHRITNEATIIATRKNVAWVLEYPVWSSSELYAPGITVPFSGNVVVGISGRALKAKKAAMVCYAEEDTGSRSGKALALMAEFFGLAHNTPSGYAEVFSLLKRTIV